MTNLLHSSNTATDRSLAIIVDLDETLCTGFDVPIAAGVDVLTRVDRETVQVHYVTARTKICREATEVFMKRHRLPGAANVHYCPDKISSREHKRRQHCTLGRDFRVIASIGDSFEEEEAAEAAGIAFIAVDPRSPAEAWSIISGMIDHVEGFNRG